MKIGTARVSETFEKRINDIENRIARSKRSRESLSELKPAGVFTAPVQPAAQPAEELYDAAGKIEKAVEKLVEENSFLKAEVETQGFKRDKMLTAKADIEAVLNTKDSEIARLFARNKQLEDENYGLRLKVNMRYFEGADGFAVERLRIRKRHDKNGIISWLKKPLIVV